MSPIEPRQLAQLAQVKLSNQLEQGITAKSLEGELPLYIRQSVKVFLEGEGMAIYIRSLRKGHATSQTFLDFSLSVRR